MNIKDFINKMKLLQGSLLEYLDSNSTNDEKIKNLFIKQKIFNNQHEFKSLLHLIANISNTYVKDPNFYPKIDSILSFFNAHIKKFFSNSEIFNIFKGNKRILLSLIEQKIMIFDKYIAKQIIAKEQFRNYKYPQYFAPEIKPLMEKKLFQIYHLKKKKFDDGLYDIIDVSYLINEINREFDENFYENRRIGENDNYICELIRNDSIKEFVMHVVKNNIPLNSTIKPSIFETHLFLNEQMMKRNMITLIEYAAFSGSKKIFNYLQHNSGSFNQSIFLYAINGKCPTIIHFIEDEDIIQSYDQFFLESIKYHNNSIAYYIQYKYLQTDVIKSQNTLLQSIKYYNFDFIQDDLIDCSLFFYLCKFDYYILVDILLKENDFDINKRVISISCFHVTKYGRISISFIHNSTYSIYYYFFDKMPFSIAVRKGNIEIIKLLLANDKLDINLGEINKYII